MIMEEKKLLFEKKKLTMFSLVYQSKNPMLLLRWLSHFYLVIFPSEAFFLNKVISFENLLFPDFLIKVKQLFESYTKIYPDQVISMFETFRSKQRQDYLYHSGATRRHLYGLHLLGLAVDVTKFWNGAHRWTLEYDLLRRNGNEIGLTNLYPFESCHFQFFPVSMQNDFFEFYNKSILVIQDILNLKIDGILGKISQGAILLNKQRLIEYFDNLELKIKEKKDNE